MTAGRVTFAEGCNRCGGRRLRSPTSLRTATAALAAASGLFHSCATENFANAPREIVDDCQREVAILTDPEFATDTDPLQGPAMDGTPDPIGDAREANEVSGGPSLTAWPEEALMYRCLESRGVTLTADQAELLAEWQREADGGDAQEQD